MQNTENTSKKYVMLGTYVFAVLCLLAGFLLPFFNGNGILALQLPEVLKSLLNQELNPESPFSYAFGSATNIFGLEQIKTDVLAGTIVAYAAITALSLLAFIPIAFSVRKKGKAARVLYYIVEIAALIPLIFCLGIMLRNPVKYFENSKNLNVMLAVGGVALALIILCGLDTKKGNALKIASFLLSSIAFLAMFDFGNVLNQKELLESYTQKLSLTSSFVDVKSGADIFGEVITKGLLGSLETYENWAQKIAFILALVTTSLVLFNIYADAIRLAVSRKGNTFSRSFNLARYALEFLAAAGTLVFALLLAKVPAGAMLALLMLVRAIQLTIAIVSLIKGLRKTSPDSQADSVDYDAYRHDESDKKDELPSPVGYGGSDVDDGYKMEDDGYKIEPQVDGYGVERQSQPMVEANTEQPVSDELSSPLEYENSKVDDGYKMENDDRQNEIANDGYAEQPVNDYTAQADDDSLSTEPQSQPLADEYGEQFNGAAYREAEATDEIETELDEEYVPLAPQPEQEQMRAVEAEQEPFEPFDTQALSSQSGTTYLLPTEQSDEYSAPNADEAEQIDEPVYHREEEASEPEQAEQFNEFAGESQPPVQPAPAEEPQRQVEFAPAERVEISTRMEQPMPVLPIEQPTYPVAREQYVPEQQAPEQRLENPFREPYNPYESHNPFRNYEQPFNPYARQPQPAPPQPASRPQPMPEREVRPAYDPKPVQQFKPQAQSFERPAKPLQPRPVIQEFKPVPPVAEQPRREQPMYSAETGYTGPEDEFIRKLTNAEKVEFANTFIYKCCGKLGNIPDYNVGGNNKKFFSAMFIYLGRIRGMVSDGLLNKMYKELNML